MKRSHRRIIPARTTQTPSFHRTAAERAQWIERYQRSGQSQRTFAETQGLKLSQLRYWIYSPSPKAADVATTPRLQEVHMDSWPGPHAWSAEITLPAGPTIRVDAAFDRQGSILTLSWIGGTGPYRVRKATNLMLADWQDYLTNAQFPLTLEADATLGFYRGMEP